MSDSRTSQSIQQLNELAGQYLSDQAHRSSQAQQQFLQSRAAGLQYLGDLLRLQAELAGIKPPELSKVAKAILMDRQMLEEFAAGSIERCLGAEYVVFRNKRVPRIPNGALLLMDRILEIKGTRGRLSEPSEIYSEYDVPADAWFYQDSGASDTPYAVLMEMALQPCGFLSAYQGTMLISPHSNLYFRNLDGEAQLLRQVDLRGKTVSGWARMTGHTVNEETVIQKFDFRLEVDGQPFYTGHSIFGFFPEDTMLRQVGLDNGKESQPWVLQQTSPNLSGKILALQSSQLPAAQLSLRPSTGRLDLLDEIYLEPAGGVYRQGYIYATRKIQPADWYFSNHFYQDPVMPGSLGVEAILEAMRLFAIDQKLAARLMPAHFELVEGQKPFSWKYRGQILPTTGKMQLEIQLRRIEETPAGIEIEGDANLWAGAIRIYQVKNAAIRIAKG